MVAYADITRPQPEDTKHWNKDGIIILPKFVPDELIDAYVAERTALLGGTDRWHVGFRGPCSYEKVPSMLALATHRPLTEVMAKLIEQEPGLHLTLTNFKSTERQWHSDGYLNPPGVNDKYLAAWIALDDIHADAGPFEWIPGSHKWPVIERQKIFDRVKARGEAFDPDRWPSDTQGWVGDACQAEIEARGVMPRTFLAKRGDVLVWHSYLMHRGSKPRNPELERRSLIAHYSGIHARPDMPTPTRLENGSHVFVFNRNS